MAWVALVVAAAGGSILWAWNGVGPGSAAIDSVVLLMVGMLVLGEITVHRLTGGIGDDHPGVWVVAGPAVVALVGVPAAAAVAVVGAVGVDLLNGQPAHRLLVDVAVRILGIASSVFVIGTAFGVQLPMPATAIESPQRLAALLTAPVVWWAMSWVCVRVMIALDERQPVWSELTRDVLNALRGVLLLAAVGPTLLLTLGRQPLIMPLVALPVAAAIVNSSQSRQHHRVARLDPLTGLANRLAFMEALDSAIRARLPFGLCVLDLDDFKVVNDEYGHEVGDRLLQQLAARMPPVADADDALVARLGGDEFVVLWRDGAADRDYQWRAHQLARELRQPVEVAGHRKVVGASCGLAVYPQHGTDPASLLRHADRAMYRAKRHKQTAAR